MTTITAAQSALVQEHVPVALRIASPFARWMDDAEQVALLALVLAAARFDPERGPFLSFAVPTIRGELKRAARDHSRSIRLPRTIHDALMELKPIVSTLQQRLGRDPTISELIEASGQPETVVVEALAAWGRVDEEAHPESAQIDDIADDVAITVALRRGIDRLRPEDREAVMAYYFGDRTQQEIADRSGVSQMQIHRRLKRGLTELAESIERPSNRG